MRLREQELLTLPGRNERWENFMLYTQGTFWSRLVCLNTFNTLFNVGMRRSRQVKCILLFRSARVASLFTIPHTWCLASGILKTILFSNTFVAHICQAACCRASPRRASRWYRPPPTSSSASRPTWTPLWLTPSTCAARTPPTAPTGL
jgi:hypothetical protein